MILHEILNDYIGHEFHIDKELNLKLQMDCNTDSLLLSYMSLIDSWDAREYWTANWPTNWLTTWQPTTTRQPTRQPTRKPTRR